VDQPASACMSRELPSRHCTERASSPEQPPRSSGKASVSEKQVEESSCGAAVGVGGSASGAEVLATAVGERRPQPAAE